MTNSTKALSEIDTIYSQLNRDLTGSEKMRYCVSLIERTQKFVNVNAEKLTERIRKHSNELISAAQKEIIEISRKGKKEL